MRKGGKEMAAENNVMSAVRAIAIANVILRHWCYDRYFENPAPSAPPVNPAWIATFSHHDWIARTLDWTMNCEWDMYAFLLVSAYSDSKYRNSSAGRQSFMIALLIFLGGFFPLPQLFQLVYKYLLMNPSGLIGGAPGGNWFMVLFMLCNSLNSMVFSPLLSWIERQSWPEENRKEARTAAGTAFLATSLLLQVGCVWWNIADWPWHKNTPGFVSWDGFVETTFGSSNRMCKYLPAYVFAWWFGPNVINFFRHWTGKGAQSIISKIISGILLAGAFVGLFRSWEFIVADQEIDQGTHAMLEVWLSEIFAVFMVACATWGSTSGVLGYLPLSKMGMYSLGAYILHNLVRRSDFDKPDIDVWGKELLAFQVAGHAVIPDLRYALTAATELCGGQFVLESIAIVSLLVGYSVIFTLTLGRLFHNGIVLFYDFLSSLGLKVVRLTDALNPCPRKT